MESARKIINQFLKPTVNQLSEPFLIIPHLLEPCLCITIPLIYHQL